MAAGIRVRPSIGARAGVRVWGIALSPLVEALLVGGVLVLAAILRLHRFDRIPYLNETADELAFVWSGWSFLHDGVPTAWSGKIAYGNAPVYLWSGFRYRLVTPWFDHPPLYGLLVGWATSLAGAREMLEASLSVARLVSVALGVVAVALLYLLARRNYGRAVALTSILLFATIPTIVVASRLAVAESLIVVLLLGSVLATQTYLARPNGGWVWLVLAGVAAGAAGLAKVPGLTVGISVLLFLLAAKRWRSAAIASALVVGVGIVPYVLMGFIFDRALFVQVVLTQTERATGLDVLPNLLMHNVAIPVAWPDAWFPFLWIAVVFVAVRGDRLVPIGIGPYLIFLVAAVSHNDLRAPYREPLFPFLCLAGGIFLCDAILQPDLIRGALVVFGVAFGKVAEGFDGWALLGNLPHGYQLYPYLVALLAAPLAATIVWPGRAAARGAAALMVAALVVAFAANVRTITREDDLYPIPRPPIVQPRFTTTAIGLALTTYRVEPDTIPPGGSVRLWTTWVAQRDVPRVSLSAYLRPFDRRANQDGAAVALGEPISLAAKDGDASTTLLAGTLAPALPEGDYDLGVDVGGQPVEIGIVRVRRTTDERPETQTVALPTTFSDGVALDEALLATPRPSASGLIQSIALRLRATEPQQTSVKVFAHLEDGNGRLIAQSDSPPGGNLNALPVGAPVDDWRDLVIPPDTPPGRYYLTVGLYEPISGRRFATGSGTDQLALGMITVGPPLTENDVPHRLGIHLSGGIDLVGYVLTPAGTADQQKLTLYWRASGPLAHNYTVFVHVVDGSGRIRSQADGPPDGNRVPTSTWRSNQLIPDPHDIPIAGLPVGSYRVLVGLYQAPDGPPLPVAGNGTGAALVTTFQVR